MFLPSAHRNTRFNVMTINEVTLNELQPHLLILSVEALPVRLEVLHWNPQTLRVVPAFEWVLGIRGLFLTIFLFHVLLGMSNIVPLWRQHFLLHWFFKDGFSAASMFSSSSMSATRVSPFLILTSINAYRRAYASLSWRTFAYERKNAFHGHFAVSHLLKISLCVQVGVLLEVSNYNSFPEVFQGRWFAIFTIEPLVTFPSWDSFAFPSFSLKTGRSLLLLWANDWTILSQVTLIFQKKKIQSRGCQ